MLLAESLGSLTQIATPRRAAPMLSASSGLLIGGGHLGTERDVLVTTPRMVVSDRPFIDEGPDIGLLPRRRIYMRSIARVREASQGSTFTASERTAGALLHTEQGVLEANALPFLVTARMLVETEQLTAARNMLEAAPVDILNDPMVGKLRSLLAPPVVRQIAKRDVDRLVEYEWLRRQGHQHRGQWVALAGDTLIAEAPTLRQLRETLKAVTLDRVPFIHHVAD